MSTDGVAFELRAQPWMADANCTGIDPELFFPQRGESTVEAKAVCRACPVRAECLDYALSINERNGIWGGTSERQRRTIREQRTGIRRRRRSTLQPHTEQSAASSGPGPESVTA